MMKISKEQLKGKTAICVAAQNGGFISNRRFLFFKHWITEGVLKSPLFKDTAVSRRYEDFDWDEEYLGEDGLLHGQVALPSLKVLLDWYFYRELVDKYEQEEGVKPTYEWYQDTLKL